MQKKNVLITGANKGIGFEIARRLGEQSYHVIVSGRNAVRVHEATNQLKEAGASCDPLIMDVGNVDSIHAAFEELYASVSSLDVLINNAAILLDDATTFLQSTRSMIEDTLRINALGPLYVTRKFLPLLSSGSRVINVSSSAGQICSGAGQYAPVYSMSKTLLNVITMQLEASLRSRSIAVYAMCPGWVRTDMGGSGAPRSVEKGAETAVWLATEAPSSLSGAFVKDKQSIPW